MGMEHPERPEVFICYSHEDQRWLDELLTQLTPLKNRNLLDCWSDREIAPGEQWRGEIERALDSARVAVLLVSPRFLASRFIDESELPRLLSAAGKGDLTILWIPISASNYKHTELAKYQAAHDPQRPLDGLKRPDRQEAFVAISERILKAVNSSVRADAPETGREPGGTPGTAGGQSVSLRTGVPRTGATSSLPPSPPPPPSPSPSVPPQEEPAPMEELPLLRRSRSIWAAVAMLLGTFLFLFSPLLSLPDTPISSQLPLLTWQKLGWAGIGASLIICCLIRYTRERFVFKAADQLTDFVLMITSTLLDLAMHWRHQARRWAIGLVIAAILVFPAALFAFGKLRTHLDRMGKIDELRSDLLRFVCYGRLQGGNEADLRVLARSYGKGDSFLPEELSTPELRVTYRTLGDLYSLQKGALKDDVEIRRSKVRDFWKKFVEEPCNEPPEEEEALKDYLIHRALRARAQSLLLSQDGMSEEGEGEIKAAEDEYNRLKELTSEIREGEPRRRFVGVALNGLGTLQIFRYRLIMEDKGRENERRKARFLTNAYDFYLKSSDKESGGDDGEGAKTRTDNNETDLEMYLLKEALAGDHHFSDALGSRLLAKYVEFRDDPSSIKKWVAARADTHEERARFSRNPIFYLTVAQVNSVAAERLLQERPQCLQKLENPEQDLGPLCTEVAQTLRNGFLNLATSIYLGQPAKGIAREPKKNLVCVYFSNPVTGKEAAFLFGRFKALPDLELCK